jgi:hypothetical protein
MNHTEMHNSVHYIYFCTVKMLTLPLCVLRNTFINNLAALHEWRFYCY